MKAITTAGRSEGQLSVCHKPEALRVVDLPVPVREVVVAARQLMQCRWALERGVRGLSSPSSETDRLIARALVQRLDKAWWRLSSAVDNLGVGEGL